MKKMDVILHPVRFKIIQQFLSGEKKTTKELSKALPNIPQATLYRQIDYLIKAEILQIVEENQIRGTVEKVYTLNILNMTINEDELKDLTKEEHLQYFMFFTAQLVNDFDEYLQKGKIDYRKDGVGYRQYAFHLTDDEFLQFTKEIGELYQKYLQLKKTSTRKTRLISNIIIPQIRSENIDDK